MIRSKKSPPFKTCFNSSPSIPRRTLSCAPGERKTASYRLNVFKGDVFPHPDTCLRLDTQSQHSLNLFLQDLFGESIFRNPPAHHSPQFLFGLEKRHLVSQKGKEIGTGKACRTRSNNGDLFGSSILSEAGHPGSSERSHQKHIVPWHEWIPIRRTAPDCSPLRRDENRLSRIPRGKDSLLEEFEGLLHIDLRLPGRGIGESDFLRGRPPGRGPS